MMTQYESNITGNVVRENCTRERLRRRNRISCLSWCCEQTTVQNYLKKKKKEGLTLAHSWRLQAIVVGKARQQGHKPAGHSVYSQEAERGCWPSALLLLFSLKFFFVCTYLPQQPLEDNFESWYFPSIMRVLQTSIWSSDMVASTFTC